jgi:flagellar basal-body rod protein FlgB
MAFKHLFIVALLIAAAPAYADIFADLDRSLKITNQRQAVISDNLANADTPGYKAKNLLPLQSSSSIGLRRTSPMHIAGIGASSDAKVINDPNTRYETIDGNTVVIEDQMLKMTENNLEQRTTLGLMRKMTGLMRTAIGTGQ